MNTSNDILGIKPYGEALGLTLKKTFEGIEQFLSIVCRPALEEVGTMLKDHVRIWRLNNVIKILEKSKDKFEFKDGEIQLKANPKVALAVIENGCNEENEELQTMWAGLLNSSFSPSGNNDEAIIYVQILKQFSIPEVKIFKYMCEMSEKGLTDEGLPLGQTVSIFVDELLRISGLKEAADVEAILNHLSALKLSERKEMIPSIGFRRFKDSLLAWLSPTTLALTLYVRCQGYGGAISDYWGLKPWREIQSRGK
jgi:hypothetical protein